MQGVSGWQIFEFYLVQPEEFSRKILFMLSRIICPCWYLKLTRGKFYGKKCLSYAVQGVSVNEGIWNYLTCPESAKKYVKPESCKFPFAGPAKFAFDLLVRFYLMQIFTCLYDIYIVNSWTFPLVRTSCGTTWAIRTINSAAPDLG